jgi:hypothetical protein
MLTIFYIFGGISVVLMVFAVLRDLLSKKDE